MFDNLNGSDGSNRHSRLPGLLRSLLVSYSSKSFVVVLWGGMRLDTGFRIDYKRWGASLGCSGLLDHDFHISPSLPLRSATYPLGDIRG